MPFDEWFRVDSVQQYHKAITAEQFMKELAPTLWPPGKRSGWCWLPRSSDGSQDYCAMKEGKFNSLALLAMNFFLVVKANSHL